MRNVICPLRSNTCLRTVTLGYKSTLKSLRSGKAKLVIIAGNTPPLRKSELECMKACRKKNFHDSADNFTRLLYAFQNERSSLCGKQRKPIPSNSYPTLVPRPTTRQMSLGLTQRRGLDLRLWRVFGPADTIQQIELGTACGKLFRCSTMAVLDAGDSDILTGATA